MYTPKAFECDDYSKIFGLIKDNPLATLVCQTETGLEANHLPLLVDQYSGQKMLIGHIAKANPLHKKLVNDTEVLVTFQGAQAYISAGYYPSKQSDPRVVPTWNYTAVHIKGRIRFTDDKSQLRHIIEAITNSQEQHRKHPWKVSDAPDEYIDKMLNAIIGLTITLDDIQAKWKVSQNHSEENKHGVAQALLKSGQHTMAKEVAAHRK